MSSATITTASTSAEEEARSFPLVSSSDSLSISIAAPSSLVKTTAILIGDEQECQKKKKKKSKKKENKENFNKDKKKKVKKSKQKKSGKTVTTKTKTGNSSRSSRSSSGKKTNMRSSTAQASSSSSLTNNPSSTSPSTRLTTTIRRKAGQKIKFGGRVSSALSDETEKNKNHDTGTTDEYDDIATDTDDSSGPIVLIRHPNSSSENGQKNRNSNSNSNIKTRRQKTKKREEITSIIKFFSQNQQTQQQNQELQETEGDNDGDSDKDYEEDYLPTETMAALAQEEDYHEQNENGDDEGSYEELNNSNHQDDEDDDDDEGGLWSSSDEESSNGWETDYGDESTIDDFDDHDFDDSANWMTKGSTNTSSGSSGGDDGLPFFSPTSIMKVKVGAAERAKKTLSSKLNDSIMTLSTASMTTESSSPCRQNKKSNDLSSFLSRGPVGMMEMLTENTSDLNIALDSLEKDEDEEEDKEESLTADTTSIPQETVTEEPPRTSVYEESKSLTRDRTYNDTGITPISETNNQNAVVHDEKEVKPCTQNGQSQLSGRKMYNLIGKFEGRPNHKVNSDNSWICPLSNRSSLPRMSRKDNVDSLARLFESRSSASVVHDVDKPTTNEATKR